MRLCTAAGCQLRELTPSNGFAAQSEPRLHFGLGGEDEILSVEGVDAAYIGPSDLAYAIGIPPTGDNHDPKHVETVHAIYDACKAHGVAPGVHTGSVEFTKRWLDHGFQMVMLGADLGFMRSAATSQLAEARGHAS